MTAQLPRPVREVPPGGAAGRSVVGYDGSSSASVALQWAAQRARRAGTPLVVLSAVDDVRAVHTAAGTADEALAVGEAVAEALEDAWRAAEEVAVEGAGLAEAAGAAATPVSVLGDAATALVGASASAESVVVARRGGSGGSSRTAPRVGRVAFSVVDAATSPVVLVRGAAHQPGPDHPVVVGLDGSAGSERAARFAAGEAAASGARLLLVAVWASERDAPGGPVRTAAWHRGTAVGSAEGGDDDEAEPAELEAMARLRAATAVVREVAPALVLERRTARGVPSEVLLDLARGAGLLVLGARGAEVDPGDPGDPDHPGESAHPGDPGGVGAGRGGRLGATALELLTGAPCPVAVVR